MAMLTDVSDEQIAHSVVLAQPQTNQVLLEVRSALKQLGDKRTVHVSILGEDVARWTARAIDRLEGYSARLLLDYTGRHSRRAPHVSTVHVERTVRL